jgi:hypothetical protein
MMFDPFQDIGFLGNLFFFGSFCSIIISIVENRCSLAHSKRRLRVLSVLDRVSLTIVQVPHSGHFTNVPFEKF